MNQKEDTDKEDEDLSDKYAFMEFTKIVDSSSEDVEEEVEVQKELEADLNVTLEEVRKRGRKMRKLEAQINEVEARAEENDIFRHDNVDLKMKVEEQIKSPTTEIVVKASKIKSLEE